MTVLPKDLNLYQTSKCNFNCVFCRRTIEGLPKAPDVSSSLVKRIIEKFPISSCCIAGFGEPLTSEGVFDVVSTLNKSGIVPSIVTNGSLIVERYSEIKKLKLLYVSVSLNTASYKRHEEITGTEYFNDALLGVEQLVDMKMFPVMISMVVFKDNYTEIPAFLELAEQLGVDRALLLNSLPYNKEAGDKIITEESARIIRRIDTYRKDFGAKVVVSRPRYLKDTPDYCCNSPWKSVGVDGNGSITGCRRVNGPDVKYGNIADKNVWNNPYLFELRQSVKGKGAFSDYCNRCFGNVC